MKKLFVAAAVVVAVVSGLVVQQSVHAIIQCDTRFEALTLELVEVTVDGEARYSLEEYEGREFLLQVGNHPSDELLFVILQEQSVESLFLRNEEGSE